MKDERFGQVSRLFHAARALDLGARARFLGAECDGDESLRSEVESLLEQSDNSWRPPSTELGATSAALVGRQIANYRVQALIGAGGMGEVYRARDLKLGRDVAIKVLPIAMTSEPERLSRFEREARVLAALNHPNIATIYGIEETDGVRAIVMELIDGETLAARIERGPIPIDEALAIARQVVEALDTAHEKGIIHRDLKPANVTIGSSGAVKVLDFGLAKLDASGVGIPAEGRVKSQAPTVTVNATGDGRLLGTAAYMSPEQVRGQAVDKRTDIWAFGCVLYEMLTGRRPFERQTIGDTLAAILERNPDLAALPAATPPGVRRLIERCLERDSRMRLRDIGDARLDLTIGTTIEEAAERRAGAGTTTGRWRMVTFTAVVMGAATGAFFAGRFASPLRPASESAALSAPISFTVETPAGGVFPTAQGGISAPALSPDGQAIASVLRGQDGAQRIWVQRLDGSGSAELKETDGATHPFWSHDGRAIGFFAQSKLKRINASGDGLQVLAETNEVSLGGTWNAQDVIVYSSRYGLYEIAADGSSSRPVIALDPANQEDSLRFPHFLPDGRHFLFVARSGRPSNSAAYVGSLDGKRVRLFETHSSVVYSPPGYLVYLRGRSLVAREFDADTLAVGHDIFDVAADVGGNTLSLLAAMSVSRNGVLAYNRFETAMQKLQWFDRSGRLLGTLLEPASITQFRIAPDGKRVVAALQDFSAGTRNLWILDAQRPPRRLTFAATHDWEPLWSPDGSRVAFSSYRDGPLNLYVKAADGLGTDELLFASNYQKDASDWSRDGQWFSYRGIEGTTRGDVWILPLFGDRKPIAVAATAAQERDGRFSPDGRWIAYESDDGGAYQIYVSPVPPTGAKYQVSYGGGNAATWRGDGRELFFVAPDGWLTAVPVDTAGAFDVVGSPKRLFRIAINRLAIPVNTWYDVTRDGERFLVSVPLPQPPAGPLHVLLNWPARLKQTQH